MPDDLEALASKPDPYGTNTPWNGADAAKVRAWSASFGAGPEPVPKRPDATTLFHYRLGSGRSFLDVHELCAQAKSFSSRKPARPKTAVDRPLRGKVHAAKYNEETAFVNPIPGYQGFKPRLRKEAPGSKNGKITMASEMARQYVQPAKIPRDKRFGVPSWALTEFRKVCYANIGKGSPYVKDLTNPDEIGLKLFGTMVLPAEYFPEMLPTVPPRHNRTRGGQNC